MTTQESASSAHLTPHRQEAAALAAASQTGVLAGVRNEKRRRNWASAEGWTRELSLTGRSGVQTHRSWSLLQSCACTKLPRALTLLLAVHYFHDLMKCKMSTKLGENCSPKSGTPPEPREQEKTL